jgi:hypothetical protein
MTEYMMKFLAHRNGDDYQNYHKSGEYICGTNIKIVSFRFSLIFLKFTQNYL